MLGAGSLGYGLLITAWTVGMLLGAAGLLDGKRATSHWLALDVLPSFGAEPTGERVVIDGERFVLKQVHPDVDWTMRGFGDLGCRPVEVWTSGVLDAVPATIDHAVVGAAAIPPAGRDPEERRRQAFETLQQHLTARMREERAAA